MEELRALKDEHQLTLKQIERLTHYSHASWQRWLNGLRPRHPRSAGEPDHRAGHRRHRAAGPARPHRHRPATRARPAAGS
ncbi:helix-turn-helix domain-containing protein [Kitasatospora kifunensis]|uniref:helix-turn-helix domain-containing protein n=1 Tax=Kitasatospora kifunensis TaxID=58351 RepID=UPI0035E42D63